MCYSFPCQSLSVAGKQDGMEKGSGTTSSLLWEVERLLNEVENLPQVLLMENVTQVHSKRNEKAFENWKSFLESKGYKNFVCDLNASEVGYPSPIPQSRKRCFMVSILGDCKYTFPGATELTTQVIDYLEPEVDEKYYLSGDKVDRLLQTLLSKYELDNESLHIDDVASKQASKQSTLLSTNLELSHSQIVSALDTIVEFQTSSNQAPAYLNLKRIDKVNCKIAQTLCARDCKGFGTGFNTMNGVIEKK